MANKYSTTPVTPILLVVAIVAVILIGLYLLIQVIFPSSNPGQSVTSDQQALLESAVDSSIRMTVRGPIVAEENFRSYQVIISPINRSLVISKGYQGQEINRVPLSNNTPSYEQFTGALNQANFVKTNSTNYDDNLSGLCASGVLYKFEIVKANQAVKQLWASSCSSVRGSLGANLDTILKLFAAQIPNYRSLTGDLWP